MNELIKTGKAPGAGKQSGTKENITKINYRAD